MNLFHKKSQERTPEEPLEGKIVEGYYFDFTPEALREWGKLIHENDILRHPVINEEGESLGYGLPLTNIVDLRLAAPEEDIPLMQTATLSDIPPIV